AGFIPETYAAQGIGFSALLPYNPIWKIFRDISYSLLVLIVITLGFLIMFRANLGAQTVISIENALPKIAITMILIAFSYPIAGFLIDLMYISIGLFVSVLAPLHTGTDATTLHQNFTNANLGMVWEAVFPDNQYYDGRFGAGFTGPLIEVSRMGNAIMDFFPTYINHLIRAAAVIMIAPTIMGFLNPVISTTGNAFSNLSILGSGLGNLPSLLGIPLFFLIMALIIPFTIIFGAGFILGLLILLTIIFLMFRIFFMLLFGYIKLLMLVIFAPLILLLEAIPGQNTFGNWIKSIIGELIMFPAVIVILMVGEAIISLPYSAQTTQTVNNTIWTPPFLNPTITGAGVSFNSFAFLVGMGIIFIIPDLIKQLKQWIGVQPFPVQVGLGTYFAGVSAIAGGGFQAAYQAGGLTQSLPGFRNYLRSIRPLRGLTDSLFGAPGEPTSKGVGDEAS
ncbi:MAG TPA: hypothetical protein PLS49_03890, partial [Candidatus Woesebacteria bacterium]|nr:hypothetical protein [Candidatus Woesebacteria bacterium]